MNSMILLGIGRMEIDWGKNRIIKDHSVLFQQEDVKLIPYYYIGDDDKLVIIEKIGYSKKLKYVKKRLDLLGYTLKEINELYDKIKYDYSCCGIQIPLSFESFSNVIKTININRVNTPMLAIEFEDDGYDFGEFTRRCIIPENEIYDKLLESVNGDKNKLNWNLEYFFENLDPYIILRLLAENDSCTELDVFWSYADVVDNGWINKEDAVLSLPIEKKILIVTEGSSDSFIIQKTLNELYPEISDFFYFIDMHQNYPFTGIGNLYNFCCGLMKIDIQNKIIVIFDNDTAGNEKYNKLHQFPQMRNILITKLPYVCDLEKIETIGPQGKSIENINGRAVAIECFLDFELHRDSPMVRWTNYVENQKDYQGSLIYKDEYVRNFKKANLKNNTYNTKKLKLLIDYLLEEWCNYYHD